MEIGRDEVLHVAALSRLVLGEEETARMQRELGEILDYMKLIGTAEAEDAAAPASAADALRADEVQPSFDRARLLQNAAVHNGACIVVPKTVE